MSIERTLVVRDGDRVREVLLVGTVTVGRSPLCEISGVDPRLSREHAVFEVVGDDVVVRDLESVNGTRVDGARIGEHRLIEGQTVEVGPFAIQLVAAANPAAAHRPPPPGNDDATVLLPPRPRGPAAPASPERPPAAATPKAARPPAATPAEPPAEEATDQTRIVRRAPAVQPSTPAPAPAPAAPSVRPASTVPPAAPPARTDTVARQGPVGELTFARAMLLWVVPVALVSFLAGLVPAVLQPDERAPLLHAHYAALAASAVELVRVSSEPALPLDGVTTALRRHTGVTGARILAGDGRVLAPLNEAGTRLDVPPVPGSAPRIVEAASGMVDVHVPAVTADRRAVVVALAVDPSLIHPAPAGSAIGTVLLMLCLGTAWLVARQLTRITDSRLSRLGEEVELMTTRQVSAGHDPFVLRGGQRILDAATFALSPAARRPGGAAPRTAGATGGPVAAVSSAAATIEADTGFRIVQADAGCEALLGVAPDAVRGVHLIEALGDQAVADEVLRLVTLATPAQAAHGEVTPAGGGGRLGIDVTRGGGAAPLTIRFRKL